MHFFKVPRLGSYMAIPLEYKSCLTQKALDQAIVDYNAFQRALEEQERAKKEWDDENEKLKEERERAGDAFTPEERSWPDIKEKGYLTKPRKYVVCLDSLGQDREFTSEERKFALDTVSNFASIWEKRESENLTKDRNLRLQLIELDKDFAENIHPKLLEEEDDYVKE